LIQTRNAFTASSGFHEFAAGIFMVPTMSAMNSFTVIIKTAIMFGSATWLGNGEFEFSFDFGPATLYTIQYSTNLVNWTSVLTFDGDGERITLIDPNAGQNSQRFYRVFASP
jgi:hypothetical protein